MLYFWSNAAMEGIRDFQKHLEKNLTDCQRLNGSIFANRFLVLLSLSIMSVFLPACSWWTWHRQTWAWRRSEAAQDWWAYSPSDSYPGNWCDDTAHRQCLRPKKDKWFKHTLWINLNICAQPVLSRSLHNSLITIIWENHDHGALYILTTNVFICV